jgi:glycerate kinase
LIGVCEGFTYGLKAGLDLNTMLESITKGAAGCWSLDVLAPKIVKGDFSPGFSVDNFVKDLTIALEEAEAMKLSLPGLALVKQLYITVQAMDKGSSGNQALYLALEKLSNMDSTKVNCELTIHLSPLTIHHSPLIIHPMRILISPNAFKHSLTAEEAAVAIREGLMQSKLDCTCECFPIGDGGDGTGELIIKKCGGELVKAAVHDALGRKINASFGLIDKGKTAVIEMADASGIRLLKPEELNPLQATSFGTGEQIKVALDKGANKIIIPMGGSATVDGGSGILNALGIRFLDATGKELSNLPASLTELASVETSGMDERIKEVEVIVLCDVDNLLLGAQGAAAIFGPQKGASAEDVQKLDAALTRLAAIALQQTGKDMSAIKYGGTAGGAAAGLYAFLNAELVNGIDHFLQLTGFDKALEKTDLVITGEGSIDEQTLQGKGPFGVACRAKLKGIPVIGLAGKVPIEQNVHLQKYFDVLLPISHQPLDLKTALASTAKNLIRTSGELGNLLAIAK